MATYDLKVRLKQPNSERKPLQEQPILPKEQPASKAQNSKDQKPIGNERRPMQDHPNFPKALAFSKGTSSKSAKNAESSVKNTDQVQAVSLNNLPVLYINAQPSRHVIAISSPNKSQSALQQLLQGLVQQSLDPPSTLRALSKLATTQPTELTATGGASTPKKPLHLLPTASKKTGIPSLELPETDSPPPSPNGAGSGMTPSQTSQPNPSHGQNCLYLPFLSADLFLFELLHRNFEVVYEGGDCNWGPVVRSILQGLLQEPEVPSWRETHPNVISGDLGALSRFEGVFDVVMARQMRRVSLESEFNELLFSVGVIAAWSWFLITGRLIIICNDHPQRAEMERILRNLIRSLKNEVQGDFIKIHHIRLENLESAFEPKSKHTDKDIYLIVDDKLKRGVFKSYKLVPSCPVIFLDSKKFAACYHAFTFFERCVKLVILQHENEDLRVSVNRQLYWYGASKLENVQPATKGFPLEMQFLLSKIMSIQLDKINNDSAPAPLTHYSLNVRKDNFQELQNQVAHTMNLFTQEGWKDFLIWAVPPSNVNSVMEVIKYYKGRYQLTEDIEVLIIRSLDPKDNIYHRIKGEGQGSRNNNGTQRIMVCQFKYEVLPQFVVQFEADVCFIWNTQTSKETTFQGFVREYIRTIMKRKESAVVAINQENIQASLRNVRVNVKSVKLAGPIQVPKFLNRHLSTLEGPIRYDGPLQIWPQKLEFKSQADQRTEILVKEDEISVFLESNEDSLDQLNKTMRRKDSDSEKELSSEKSRYLGLTDSEKSAGEPFIAPKPVQKPTSHKKTITATKNCGLQIYSLPSIVVFQKIMPVLHTSLIRGLNLATMGGKPGIARYDASPERVTRAVLYSPDPRWTNQCHDESTGPRYARRHSGAKQSMSKRAGGETSPISSPQKAFSPNLELLEAASPEAIPMAVIAKQELVQQPELPKVSFTKSETPNYQSSTFSKTPGVPESQQLSVQPQTEFLRDRQPVAPHQFSPGYGVQQHGNSVLQHAEPQTPPRHYSPEADRFAYKQYSPSEPAYAFEEYHQQTTTTGMVYTSTTMTQSVASQGFLNPPVKIPSGPQGSATNDIRETSQFPLPKNEAVMNIPRAPAYNDQPAGLIKAYPYQPQVAHNSHAVTPQANPSTHLPSATSAMDIYVPAMTMPSVSSYPYTRSAASHQGQSVSRPTISASREHPHTQNPANQARDYRNPDQPTYQLQPMKLQQPEPPSSGVYDKSPSMSTTNSTISALSAHSAAAVHTSSTTHQSNTHSSTDNHNSTFSHSISSTNSGNNPTAPHPGTNTGTNNNSDDGAVIESRVFTRKVARAAPVATSTSGGAARPFFLGKRDDHFSLL